MSASTSQSSLRRAERQLCTLIDVAHDERGEVPSWLFAAHQAVVRERKRYQARKSGEQPIRPEVKSDD